MGEKVNILSELPSVQRMQENQIKVNNEEVQGLLDGFQSNTDINLQHLGDGEWFVNDEKEVASEPNLEHVIKTSGLFARTEDPGVYRVSPYVSPHKKEEILSFMEEIGWFRVKEEVGTFEIDEEDYLPN